MTYFDAAGGSTIIDAMKWLEAALLGPLATSIAVIAVANIGFLMLAGRIDIRRGAEVVLGCFLLFGAPAIAEGIFGTVPSPPAPMPGAADPLPPVEFAEPMTGASSGPSIFDPYAGAAVPQD